ncbi:hypothetical protein B9T16_20830 [Arthrospira sp. PCC 8006]|uniref:hypothetical protein n=1 Tax=Arthrospira sp. PCC 8006 TaxID=1982224 RepID=UPI00396EF943
MPLNDAYNKYKAEFVAKLAQPKGTCLGRSLMVEAPVDKTSKHVIPMPMLLLYTLSGNALGLEPSEVRGLTIWKPPVRSTSTYTNANRRNIIVGSRVRAWKRSEYTRIFVEAPLDTQGVWRTYTTSGTNAGERKLRFISLKVPLIFSISSLLYVFAKYWSKKPASIRTYNSMFRIPASDDMTLAKLGELTTGKTEAPNQVQGNLSALPEKTGNKP